MPHARKIHNVELAFFVDREPRIERRDQRHSSGANLKIGGIYAGLVRWRVVISHLERIPVER